MRRAGSPSEGEACNASYTARLHAVTHAAQRTSPPYDIPAGTVHAQSDCVRPVKLYSVASRSPFVEYDVNRVVGVPVAVVGGWCGGRAGFPRERFFPCRFQRAYLGVVELSSQPKYALVPYHAIAVMSSAIGKSRPDSYAVT